MKLRNIQIPTEVILMSNNEDSTNSHYNRLSHLYKFGIYLQSLIQEYSIF